MKKVGYLTSHASMNFGGLLQAYALKEMILSLGYDCEIINYTPQVHDIKKHPIQFVLQRKGFINKAIFGCFHRKDLKKRMQIIGDFRRKYLNPQPSNALEVTDLPMSCKKYDLLCVGSDQLWNLHQKDNENRVYMLDFDHVCKSLSYAVSFGDGLQNKEKEIEDALPLIKKFTSISVREQEGKNFLEEHGIDAEVVLDPTLVVDESFWNRFRGKNRIVSKPYILVYGFENAHQKYGDLIAAARKAAGILKLPVVNPIFSPALGNAHFENYYICGPEEFVNLVENAEFVVTNSFHGSIFSVLCSTPFIAIKSRGIGIDSRKTNLLRILDMENRLVFPDEKWDMKELMLSDFEKNRELLGKHRKNSVDYLVKALKRCE